MLASAAKICADMIRSRIIARPASESSLRAAAAGTFCSPCVPRNHPAGTSMTLGRLGGPRRVCGPQIRLGGLTWENVRPSLRKFFWNTLTAAGSLRMRWRSSSWTTWVLTWVSGLWSRPGQTTFMSSSSLQIRHISLSLLMWLSLLL